MSHALTIYVSPVSLQSVTVSVNSSISVSVANSTVVSEVVASTSGLLEQIRLLLEQLAVALDLSVVTPDMVLNADSTPQPLPQAINDLQESIAGLLQLLMGVRTHVIAAEQHGADLSTAAMEVERQAAGIVFSALLLTSTVVMISFCSLEHLHSMCTTES